MIIKIQISVSIKRRLRGSIHNKNTSNMANQITQKQTNRTKRKEEREHKENKRLITDLCGWVVSLRSEINALRNANDSISSERDQLAARIAELEETLRDHEAEKRDEICGSFY